MIDWESVLAAEKDEEERLKHIDDTSTRKEVVSNPRPPGGFWIEYLDIDSNFPFFVHKFKTKEATWDRPIDMPHRSVAHGGLKIEKKYAQTFNLAPRPPWINPPKPKDGQSIWKPVISERAKAALTLVTRRGKKKKRKKRLLQKKKIVRPEEFELPHSRLSFNSSNGLHVNLNALHHWQKKAMEAGLNEQHNAAKRGNNLSPKEAATASATRNSIAERNAAQSRMEKRFPELDPNVIAIALWQNDFHAGKALKFLRRSNASKDIIQRVLSKENAEIQEREEKRISEFDAIAEDVLANLANTFKDLPKDEIRHAAMQTQRTTTDGSVHAGRAKRYLLEKYPEYKPKKRDNDIPSHLLRRRPGWRWRFGLPER
eukprot:g5847.t1